MRDIFQTEDKAYKFQYKFLVKISNIKSVRYGTYTASFIGTRIWNVIPEDKDSLKVFKENMKNVLVEMSLASIIYLGSSLFFENFVVWDYYS